MINDESEMMNQFILLTCLKVTNSIKTKGVVGCTSTIRVIMPLRELLHPWDLFTIIININILLKLINLLCGSKCRTTAPQLISTASGVSGISISAHLSDCKISCPFLSRKSASIPMIR
jgi:hypothetical protein